MGMFTTKSATTFVLFGLACLTSALRTNFGGFIVDEVDTKCNDDSCLETPGCAWCDCNYYDRGYRQCVQQTTLPNCKVASPSLQLKGWLKCEFANATKLSESPVEIDDTTEDATEDDAEVPLEALVIDKGIARASY